MKIRTVAITTTVILGTLTLLFLFWVFRQALVLFVFSLAFAAAARPSVDALIRRGIQRTIALILVYSIFLGVFLVGLLAIGGALLHELQLLVDSFAHLYDRVWTEWPKGTQFQQIIVQQLPPPADLYQSFSPEKQSTTLQGLLGFTVGSANFLGQLVTILILSIYWSIDRVHFERLWLSLLPVEIRARSRDVWRRIEEDFGSYVRSEVFQSLLASVLLGIGLWLLGVRYPILLAIFASLAWFIPWLGGVAAVLVIGASAFMQGSWLGIIAAVYTGGVLFFLEMFVERRFLRHSQFSSLLPILLILALVEPFGLLGFIVAPPLAAAIELIFRYNLQTHQQPAGMESVRRISELREKIQSIRDMSAASEEPLEPQVQNLLERMEELVGRADNVLDSIKEQPESKRTSLADQLRIQG
jgi:predicted PurR-regulated permease PerM